MAVWVGTPRWLTVIWLGWMGEYHSFLLWVIKITSILIFSLYSFHFILHIPIRVIFLKYNYIYILSLKFSSRYLRVCKRKSVRLWVSWQLENRTASLKTPVFYIIHYKHITLYSDSKDTLESGSQTHMYFDTLWKDYAIWLKSWAPIFLTSCLLLS